MPTKWMRFTMTQVKELPRRLPCIYALYDHSGLIYIGQTVDIYNRFSTCHRRRRDVTHVKARMADIRDLYLLERRLIRRLRPAKNKNFTGRPQPRGVNPWRRA